MATTIKIYKDAGKEFRWTWKSGNNEKIANSGEGYKTHEGVVKAVERIQSSIPGVKVEDATKKK